MPGAPTHIAIADKIYYILGKDVIHNLPLFFGGNIAPDAIHAKPNYIREDKRRTHLTVGMPIDEFQNPRKLKIFHERVNEFINNYYLPAGEEKDLYLGYIIHLLVDELFNTTARTPFNRLMFKDGIEQAEQDYFGMILKDIDGIDKIIIGKYGYSQNVAAVLDSVWDYEIKDYIGKAEINSSKHHAINKYFKSKAPSVSLKYYSDCEAFDFVDYAVNNILTRLSGKSDLLTIL